MLIDTGGIGFVPALRQSGTSTSGTLKVVTTNMLPGYIRKNGVPYSDKAVLTEYFNRADRPAERRLYRGDRDGRRSDVSDGPFIRTYTFKKVPDPTGWEPTPCWTK